MDLRHIDLLALISADTALKRAASTGGGEYAGTCPDCGGTDRFRVWPMPPDGNPRYWCRGCGASGDAISYLRWRNPELSFKDACARLGVTPTGRGVRIDTTSRPAINAPRAFVPTAPTAAPTAPTVPTVPTAPTAPTVSAAPTAPAAHGVKRVVLNFEDQNPAAGIFWVCDPVIQGKFNYTKDGKFYEKD